MSAQVPFENRSTVSLEHASTASAVVCSQLRVQLEIREALRPLLFLDVPLLPWVHSNIRVHELQTKVELVFLQIVNTREHIPVDSPIWGVKLLGFVPHEIPGVEQLGARHLLLLRPSRARASLQPRVRFPKGGELRWRHVTSDQTVPWLPHMLSAEISAVMGPALALTTKPAAPSASQTLMPVACEPCLPAESRSLFQGPLVTELRPQVPRQLPLSASQASVRQPLLVVSGLCKSLQLPAVSEVRSLSMPRPSPACSVLAAAESVDVMAAVSKRLSLVRCCGPCDVQSSADLDVSLDEGLGLAEADSLVGVVVFMDGCDGGEYPLERLPARTVASLRSVGGFQRGSSRIPVL